MLPSRFNFHPDIVGTPLGAVGFANVCCPRGGAGTEAGSSLPRSPNRDMVGLLVTVATVLTACFAFSDASFCRAKASAFAAFSSAAFFAAAAFSAAMAAAFSREAATAAAFSSSAFFAAAAFSVAAAAAFSREAAAAAAADLEFAAGALGVALPPTK